MQSHLFTGGLAWLDGDRLPGSVLLHCPTSAYHAHTAGAASPLASGKSVRPSPCLCVLQEAYLRVCDLKPQELFNIAWAFAQVWPGWVVVGEDTGHASAVWRFALHMRLPCCLLVTRTPACLLAI